MSTSNLHTEIDEVDKLVLEARNELGDHQAFEHKRMIKDQLAKINAARVILANAEREYRALLEDIRSGIV